MSQTMLLTKRLSTFLNNNTTPQIHTLLLITPVGKLLSSASPSPTSILRTQSTLACSLWNLYNPYVPNTANLVSAALPQDSDPNTSSDARIRNGAAAGKDVNCIVIQLEHGIMVIRALKCGLLFVAIGHSSSSAQMQPPHSPQSHYQQSFVASHSPPPSSPDPQAESHHDAHENPILLQLPIQTSSGPGAGGGSGSAAPSEAGSTITNASIGSPATIFGMKRQTEELAKWLDGKLEGFKLSPPEGR
ncbi:hypothetical protein F5884DRAFT_775047 [Xylogone sp. PMI_703]|nr:hypothetical protein F5884DRAFT_775047 [Xylogone sp. PMI_703]